MSNYKSDGLVTGFATTGGAGVVDEFVPRLEEVADFLLGFLAGTVFAGAFSISFLSGVTVAGGAANLPKLTGSATTAVPS